MAEEKVDVAAEADEVAPPSGNHVAEPTTEREVRVVTEQVVKIQNPLKSAAGAARDRWVGFLDTSYDGSIVWAVRRGCQWVAVFFRSLRGLAGGGRG